jgi:cyclase
MLKTRIIPTLLHRDFGLVKGVGFDSRRAVGSPMQALKVYGLRGVDELVFLDVSATVQGRPPDFELVDHLADECFMPLTVGGGVHDLDHVRRLLQVGADKVSIGTAAVDAPGLVRAAADRFGPQSIVAAIDFRTGRDGRTCVWTRSGTMPTGIDPVELAVRLQGFGIGEILLTSIERDGTMGGYDIATIQRVTAAVTIPVIASGGAGSYADLAAAILDGGASAVAAASIFHFTHLTPQGAKEHLAERGVPVRRIA